MAIVSHIPPLLLAGLAALFGAGAATAEPFRDCPGCPPMVTLAPGAFTMGSTPEETTRERIDPGLIADERPAHPVTVATAFAIGQFAVTRGEFAAFVAATGHASTGGCYVLSGDSWAFDRKRNWRDPGFAQTDQHPVVCVSHRDAQRYAQWLARTTKKPYRLPSEAEWE
jgi:formylglycine-generating enzyme required for sulfatase activity